MSSTNPGTDSGSSSKSSNTLGVTHPAQSLVLGNTAVSRRATSWPCFSRVHAQLEPAGPPPMMMVSKVCMVMSPAASVGSKFWPYLFYNTARYDSKPAYGRGDGIVGGGGLGESSARDPGRSVPCPRGGGVGVDRLNDNRPTFLD